MTDEINGFAIEPSCRNRHLFRRVSEPEHEYVFEITPKRVVLHATLPDEIGRDRADALDDADAPKRMLASLEAQVEGKRKSDLPPPVALRP
jgi:hypothetical protein